MRRRIVNRRPATRQGEGLPLRKPEFRDVDGFRPGQRGAGDAQRLSMWSGGSRRVLPDQADYDRAVAGPRIVVRILALTQIVSDRNSSDRSNGWSTTSPLRRDPPRRLQGATRCQVPMLRAAIIGCVAAANALKCGVARCASNAARSS